MSSNYIGLRYTNPKRLLDNPILSAVEADIVKEDVTVNVKYWGAKGDGVTDDTAAIQAALDSTATNIKFGDGTYRITSTVTLTRSNVRLNLENATINYDAPQGTDNFGSVAIKIQGVQEASRAVSDNIAEGAQVITGIATTTDITAGNFVKIFSTEGAFPGHTNPDWDRGFFAKVLSVDSATQITIFQKAPFAFSAAASLRCQPVTPVENVHITNGTLSSPGRTFAHNGITFEYCQECSVTGTTLQNFESTGVRKFWSIGITTSNAFIYGCTSPSESGGPVTDTVGYGVLFSDAAYCSMTNCTCYNNRHSASCGRNAHNIIVDGNTCYGVVDDASYIVLDNHETAYHVVYSNNTVFSTGEGVGCRGPYCTITGNVINAFRGVRIHDFTVQAGSTRGQFDVTITNNVFQQCTVGCYLDGDSNTDNENIIVANNVFADMENYAIFGRYNNNLIIQSNVIQRVHVGSGTNGNAIRLLDCDNVLISGNSIRETASEGIELERVNNVKMASNDLEDMGIVNAVSAIRCLTVDNCNITGNMINSTANNATACIACLDVTNCIINANNLSADLGGTSDAISVNISAAASSDFTIIGNIIINAGRYGIRVANTSSVIIKDNNIIAAGTQPISYASLTTGLFMADNLPISVLATGATPSVEGVSKATTANVAPTTITNFTDGVVGQEITIIIADANTTIDITANANIVSNGAADLTGVGTVFKAVYDGTRWCAITN